MKRCYAQFFAAALALAGVAPLGAEVFTSTYTATQCQDYNLLTEMLIGPGVARHPSGAKIPQTSSVQIGVFSNLVAQAIPTFTNGVVLSTGKITDGSSVSNTSAKYKWADEALPDLGQDADLNAYFGEDLSDPAGLVLYVQPRNKTLNIPFVMASEEFYHEMWEAPSADLPTLDDYRAYSDKFAFFLEEIADASDPSAYDPEGNVVDVGASMARNIAKLPDGGDVEIASVNQHTNTQYFISNVVADDEGKLAFPATDILLPMEFNGAIVGPVAVAEGLDTNKVYKLKIIIGDGYDNTVNSAVFLRERGITSGADLKMAVEGPAHLTSSRWATFTDTVSNIGPATADGVQVTHCLPVGVDPSTVTIEACDAGSVDPASWREVNGTNTFVWTVGDGFAPGSNAVLRIRCMLPEKGAYTNCATVATSTGDYDESNNAADCVTTVGELPMLRVAAISTNKVYGTEITCSDLQFVLSVEGTDDSLVAAGVDVVFTNALGEAAQPTNTAAVVGTYGIVLSNIRGLDLSTYGGVTYVPGTLTIDPAALTVKAEDDTKTYGDEKTLEKYTVVGLLNGDTVTAVALASDGAVAEAPCAEYPITVGDVRGTGLENYRIDRDGGTLTVNRRPLEITARNIRKPYGEMLDFVGDEFLVTGGELLHGATVDSVTLTSAGAAKTASYKADGYEITASDAQGTGLENYVINFKPGKLSVERRALTVKADDVMKAYGDTVTLAAYTVTGLQNNDKVEAVVLESAGAPATAPYREGGYEITVTDVQGTGLENYLIERENGTLTVTRRVLTVKADDVTKAYGDAVTLVAYTVTGLQNDDKVEAVTLASDGAAATAPYRAEGYEITLSNVQGTGLENYEIAPQPGKLTVTKRMLTVRADDVTKVYGDAVTLAAYTVIGLQNDDKVESVTLESDGAAATAPYRTEGYPITLSNPQGTGLENYQVSTENGTLTVTKRMLGITARNMQKPYGETLDFVGDEFLVTSGTLASGDTVDAVTLVSDGAEAQAAYKAEGYPIAASAAQGTGLANYEIAYVDGTLTITKRPITITANSTTKTYGEAVDFAGTEFTLTSGTLAAGDAVDSVTLASDGAAATAAYRAEGYPITASAAQGTGLANYEIAYADGTLSVTKRPLTITANDASKVYGEAVDFAGTEFTLTSGTLAAGDAVDSVTLASDGAAAAAAYRAEGYPITASAAQGTGLANYEITYADGTLSVTKRALEITARNIQKPYGETLDFVGDEFLITSGTLAAGDTLDSVTLASDGAPAAAPWRAVGYEIKVTDVQGTGLENYDITRKPGTLTITKRALMITANDATKAYGETLTFEGTEFTVSGDLQNGERVETVTLTSEKATEPGTEVGEYAEAIVPGHVVTGIDTNNYDIAFANGTLTVTQAVLTITVNDAKWRVGRPRPAYSFADFSAQLQADDTVADVTGGAGLATDVAYTNAVWSATEPTDTDEGTYEDEIWLDPASLVGARAANYAIAIEPGDLVVRSAEAELETAVSATLNWNTGLLDLELTIRNKGDGEVEPDFDYWVELKAGASANGAVASVEKSFYLDSPTGTMPDGYDYVDLTAQVKAALKSVGNGDAVFDPGEAVTVKGVSVYHWKRWSPEKFIDVNTFFVAGRLFNPADTDRNFIVSEAEKAAAAALLGTSSADYLEVSRLALLPYYHWKSADGTWK